ncbi:MAG TPA: hypothetical protein VGX26_03790 [Solirubrobacteraceae bacterium]|jgi:hypothetical protein|nr:hypothetical protein [Solirubrobacteraceae bacterium]
MPKQQRRLVVLAGAVLAIFVAAYVVAGLTVNSVIQPTKHPPRSLREPDTAEVANELREDGVQRVQVITSKCNQTSPGHWTCSVRAADGQKGTVQAIWYGRERTLGTTLLAPGFR